MFKRRVLRCCTQEGGVEPPLRKISRARFRRGVSRGVDQADAQSDFAYGVSRATEARIIGTDNGRNAVEHAFVKLCPIYKMFADLLDAAADRQIVVAGGNDQVGPGDGTVFIDLIVVDEHAARRFNHAHTFQRIDSPCGAYLLVENLRIGEKHFYLFEGMG